MPHAGLGGRSVYERAPDPETDPRSPPLRAEFALRYSRYYSVLLNSVLAYSRYYSSPHSARFVEPGRLRSPWTLRRSVPTLGSVGSKTQYL